MLWLSVWQESFHNTDMIWSLALKISVDFIAPLINLSMPNMSIISDWSDIYGKQAPKCYVGAGRNNVNKRMREYDTKIGSNLRNSQDNITSININQ